MYAMFGRDPSRNTPQRENHISGCGVPLSRGERGWPPLNANRMCTTKSLPFPHGTDGDCCDQVQGIKRLAAGHKDGASSHAMASILSELAPRETARQRQRQDASSIFKLVAVKEEHTYAPSDIPSH